MDEWDGVLRELADDPAEYEREAGTVLLTRQGHEHVMTLREVPGEGLCVINEMEGFVPISTYVQRDLLGLPRLAKQVIKTLEKAWIKRPGKFIEGPATFAGMGAGQRWERASQELRGYLNQAEPGTTRLVELMAAAGQGKTALLEHAALEFARQYQPASYPTPILLTVDLLGRYVGTVDDAIAGALNNTYVFPSLTQRDVALCIRRRWLILALDGFDELVARVGVREAFLRITELLDQLQSSGTIIVSARESFFELYQITSAIRSFLQPRNGSYSTAVIRLLEWSTAQGCEVFAGLGSAEPQADLAALMNAFEGDTEIVYHPFFLTRLADLWSRGERFVGADRQGDHLMRTKYVIETFVQRESGEKWIDRDGNTFLNADGHNLMLSGISEEMWRSGAFWLGLDELRIAAEIALAELDLPAGQLEKILERVPTHAALLPRERGYAFLHDRFLHFYLGLRIANLLRKSEWAVAREVMLARELSPSVVEWIAWNWRRTMGMTNDLLKSLNEMPSGTSDTVLTKNVAHVFGKILDGYDSAHWIEIKKQSFEGDMLRNGIYEKVRFVECQFWYLDATGSKFSNCQFVDCVFGDVLVDDRTQMVGTRFKNCRIASIEAEDHGAAFAPEQIAERLRRLGAEVEVSTDVEQATPRRQRVREDVSMCVQKFVKASERTCDVAIEDVEEYCGPTASAVARFGMETGVLREIVKGVSGPKKTFVRFKVDRERLLRGQVGATGDGATDLFWAGLEKKYPPKN